MHALRWAMMLLSPALVLAIAARISCAAGIDGPMRCSIYGYGWPLSVNDTPIAADAGIIDLVSDGKGQFVSGQMTRHVGDDTRTAAGNVCTFDLERGTYTQQADGTIANIITWKLRAVSDPHCGALVTNSKNLGFTEGAHDFRPVTYRSTSYVLESDRTGYVGSSVQGVVMGLCERVEK